jgi:hypothetical protein
VANEFVAAELGCGKVPEQDATPMREIKEQFKLSKKNFSDPEQDELTLHVSMGRINISHINVERGIPTLDRWAIYVLFIFIDLLASKFRWQIAKFFLFLT